MDQGALFRAVASNRPTETLVSVISFAFVVYVDHKHSKYLGRELNHGPIASVISFFLATALHAVWVKSLSLLSSTVN